MDPEELEALLQHASELLEQGQPAETLRCLDELEGQLSDDEDRIECVAVRAWALSELARTDEALALLTPALEEFPDSARLHTTRGVVLANADDLEAAREALELAISLDHDDGTALANLGLVYEELRAYEHASQLYDRALAVGADLDWALARKAAVQSEAGDRTGAKVSLKRCLSLNPDDAGQWIALAILCSEGDEFDEARRCYRQAEELDPDSASLRFNWGVTALRAGSLPEARDQLERLAALATDSARVFLLRAFVLEEEQNAAAAEACFQQALAHGLADDHADLVYTLEMAMDFFVRQGQVDRCEELLARAYKSNACTVELCDAHREMTGTHLDEATWFSLNLEADYRPGLVEVVERDAEGDAADDPALAPGGERRFTRFLRNYQVVARDRDEAVALVLAFSRRMGETGVALREFLSHEQVADAYTGIYEVDKASLVFDEEPDQ